MDGNSEPVDHPYCLRDINETNILLFDKIQYRRRKIANQCHKNSFRILTQVPLVPACAEASAILVELWTGGIV